MWCASPPLPHLLELAAVAHDEESGGVDDEALSRVDRDLHLDVWSHAEHLLLASACTEQRQQRGRKTVRRRRRQQQQRQRQQKVAEDHAEGHRRLHEAAGRHGRRRGGGRAGAAASRDAPVRPPPKMPTGGPRRPKRSPPVGGATAAPPSRAAATPPGGGQQGCEGSGTGLPQPMVRGMSCSCTPSKASKARAASPRVWRRAGGAGRMENGNRVGQAGWGVSAGVGFDGSAVENEASDAWYAMLGATTQSHCQGPREGCRAARYRPPVLAVGCLRLRAAPGAGERRRGFDWSHAVGGACAGGACTARQATQARYTGRRGKLQVMQRAGACSTPPAAATHAAVPPNSAALSAAPVGPTSPDPMPPPPPTAPAAHTP